MPAIMAWNTTSLVKIARRNEVERLIRKTKAKVVLLQETRWSVRHRPLFAGMTLYRSDEGAGTAVLVNNRWRSSRVTIGGLRVISTTAVETGKKDDPILVMSVYIPCAVGIKALRDDLGVLMSTIQKYRRFCIGGDLNAHHPRWNVTGDNSENAAGREINRR